MGMPRQAAKWHATWIKTLFAVCLIAGSVWVFDGPSWLTLAASVTFAVCSVAALVVMYSLASGSGFAHRGLTGVEYVKSK